MRSKIKALATTSLLVVSTALVGCRAEDVAIIGGAVAIIAGVEAKADRLERERHQHPPVVVVPSPPPHPRRCRTFRDRHGRIRSTCPGGYSTLALSTQTAERVETFAQLAATGDVSVASELGLTTQLVVSALAGDAELNSSVGTLAKKLELSVAEASQLVKDLVQEVRVQGTDINSHLWQTCLANGSWKTDANGGVCTSTQWQGCSPETGASVCSL